MSNLELCTFCKRPITSISGYKITGEDYLKRKDCNRCVYRDTWHFYGETYQKSYLEKIEAIMKYEFTPEKLKESLDAMKEISLLMEDSDKVYAILSSPFAASNDKKHLKMYLSTNQLTMNLPKLKKKFIKGKLDLSYLPKEVLMLVTKS